MSATVTQRTDGRPGVRTGVRTGVRPGGRPRVRHGVLAAMLFALAGINALTGDWLWAGVTAAGGLAELAVTLLERSRRAAGVRPARASERERPERSGRPDEGTLQRSLRAHRQSLRLWSVVLAVLILGAAALLSSAPATAGALGALALVALVPLRRARRSVRRLELVLVAPTRTHAPRETQ